MKYEKSRLSFSKILYYCTHHLLNIKSDMDQSSYAYMSLFRIHPVRKK